MRKYHLWAGIILAFFLINFALSGIVLNHRKAFATSDVDRSYLPSKYLYENWNGGFVRGAIQLPGRLSQLLEAPVLVYGNSGPFLSDSLLANPRFLTNGIDPGADNQRVNGATLTPDSTLWIAAQFNPYYFDQDSLLWRKVVLPNNRERVVDIAAKQDTLVVLTRSVAYVALPPYDAFAPLELPTPDEYEVKVSLLRHVWLLHSGELFGHIGQGIVDTLGVILIFLAISGVVIFIFKRIKGKSDVQKSVLKQHLKWHNKIGLKLFALTMIVCVSGALLRPPLMVPLAIFKMPALPFSTLDDENPWHDRLRAIRVDGVDSTVWVSTSDGFLHIPGICEASGVELIKDGPSVSPMGINVFEQDTTSGRWVVGSFSGLYSWNTFSGEVIDMTTGEPPVKGYMRAVSETSISGYALGQYFDYEKGVSNLAPMPAELQTRPISLWNLALEVHTGRIYPLGAWSLIFPAVCGGFLVFVLISGRKITQRKKR